MDQLSHLLAMGGYAAYVWPAWGLTLAAMAAMVLLARRRLRRAEADLAQLQTLRPRRRPGREADPA